jgi:hypothetical protein
MLFHLIALPSFDESWAEPNDGVATWFDRRFAAVARQWYQLVRARHSTMLLEVDEEMLSLFGLTAGDLP